MRESHRPRHGVKSTSVQRLRLEEAVLRATGLPKASFFLGRLEEDFHQGPQQVRQQHHRPAPPFLPWTGLDRGHYHTCLSSSYEVKLLPETHIQPADSPSAAGAATKAGRGWVSPNKNTLPIPLREYIMFPTHTGAYI